MSTEPLRAALYIRVSTDDQLEFSPDAQKRIMTEYAKKNSMEVIPEFIFIEEGISATSADKRPVFQRMIGMAKSKPTPFDVILVHKFDRFARNQHDSIVYKTMLKQYCKIKVISITESIIGDDRVAMLMEGMLGVMAEYFSINLSEEVKKGMTKKALKGSFQTNPSLGYKVVKSKDGESADLQIDEQESEIIRYIYSQFVEQSKNRFEITHQLNNMGVKTKRGNSINYRVVDYILQNPIYAGKVRWTPSGKTGYNFNNPDTIIKDGRHTEIITEEIFQKAAEKLAKNKRVTKPRARPLFERKHWLSGLIKCSNCGSSLVANLAKSTPAFQCGGYSKGICKKSHSISIAKFEDAIIDELNNALICNTEGFQLIVRHVDNTTNELDSLEKQKEKLEGRLQRANDAYLAEIYTLDEYKRIRKDLENQIKQPSDDAEALRNEQAPADNNRFKEKIHQVIDILGSDCELSAKQNAIRSIVDKIIYNSADKNIEVYYYDA